MAWVLVMQVGRDKVLLIMQVVRDRKNSIITSQDHLNYQPDPSSTLHLTQTQALPYQPGPSSTSPLTSPPAPPSQAEQQQQLL